MSRLDLRSRGATSPQKLFNIVVGIFLFAAFMNLITRNYYWTFFAFAVFIVTPSRKFEINFSTFCLFLLAISMVLFDPERRSNITVFLQSFVFLMVYIIGCGFSNKENDVKSVEKIIYLCAFGLFAHFLLNFFNNFDVMMQDGSFERNTVDFWTNDVLSATGQASLACVCVGVSVAILFSKTGVIQKIFAVAALLLVLMYNLILAGRTLLIIMAILLLLATVFRSVSLKRNIIKDVLIVSAIIALLVLLYNSNVFNVKDAFENSNFYYRFYEQDARGVAEDARFEYKLYYLKNFFKYPFGGRNIKTVYTHHAHDLYLDGYDQFGIFGFLALLVYVISSLFRMFKFLRIPEVPFETKQLVFCTYAALNIQFLVEPILEGIPFLFVAYCLIDGAVSRLLILWGPQRNIRGVRSL